MALPERIDLGLDPDDLASCVGCGLCLPHCPTYRVTGDEAASPRGRIAAMRAVDAGAPADDAFAGMMEACVQCRGCETACPSAVPFGRMMGAARAALVAAGHRPPVVVQALATAVSHPTAVDLLGTAGAVAGRLGLVPHAWGVPARPAPGARLAPESLPGGEPVWLFGGCVTEPWWRDAHEATLAVLAAAGAEVRLVPRGGCCGALARHAGLADRADGQLAALAAAFEAADEGSGDEPVLVHAAGCGAALVEGGEQVPAAAGLAARVADVHTWLAPRIGRLGPPRRRLRVPVAVADPCHLRHAQRAHVAVRTVLAPFVDLVELDDDGLCCGAGGAYQLAQPELARAIRARKLDAVRRSGAPIVASANPGCAWWLAGAGLRVVHPLVLVAAALGGDDTATRGGHEPGEEPWTNASRS